MGNAECIKHDYSSKENSLMEMANIQMGWVNIIIFQTVS